MLFQQTITPLSFKQWLWSDNENKRLLWFSAIVMVISFGWLKYVYPYPNFMPPDSYNYLESASNNDFINIWPIGYAKFLRLISVFTHSHILLVIVQYVLLMASALYFLFTIRFLLSPGQWLFRTLVIITIVNPLLPHIANFISSDCLFATLSLVWFTQLLWIINNPNRRLLIAHALIVVLSFMTRFTAIYYPLLSIAIIFILNMPSKTRWLGIGMITGLILAFIGRTQYEYKLRTGTVQYSAFGGWQLAANALYGYAYDKTDPTETVPNKFKDLHSIVNRHMDSIRNLAVRPDGTPGIYYLWDFKSPLRLHLSNQKFEESNMRFFEQWAKVAPLYAQYGRWITLKHPVSFLLHYAWPNLLRYYAPPTYFMGTYNLGKKTVDPIAVTWFNWKSNQLSNRLKSGAIHIMNVFPTLLAIINPAFIVCVVFFLFSSGLSYCSSPIKRILACMLLVWVSNTVFSVLTAPIELRYQIFPAVITLPFLLLILSMLVQLLKTDSSTSKQQPRTIAEPAL